MHKRGLIRMRDGFLASLFFLVLGATALKAQNLCVFCNSVEPFGGCFITTLDFPGGFPGSAAKVRVGDLQFIYVVDYFSGLTYKFAPNGNPNTLLDFVESVDSPAGSRRTSGLAFNPNDNFLYWAIGEPPSSGAALPPNPRLVRTSTDVTDIEPFESAVEIDLVELANALNLPEVGELGGITVHEQRNTFWGVDIVNDIYFEFDFSGQPVVENDQVVHFRNPRSSDGPQGTGLSYAYGNDITYVSIGGDVYFDIPVGSLREGGVTAVERVFATSGSLNGLDFSVGDPTGMYYNTRDAIGPHGFLTGLYQWNNSCGADQNVVLLLELGTTTTDARIQIVQTDTPPKANKGVAEVSCVASGNNVDLTWRFYEDLRKLEIDRLELATGESEAVVSFDSQNDPAEVKAGEHTLRNSRVSDGVYEYTLVATTTTGDTLPPRYCRVTVGRGQVASSVDYVDSTSPEDTHPFAITYVGSIDRVLVADSVTGRGHTFTADLEPRTTFDGPFTDDFTFDGGFTVGVAWNPDLNEVVWVIHDEGQNFLRRTSLDIAGGEIVGVFSLDSPTPIRTPVNLVRTPVLGDLAYDPIGREYWAVDLLNGVVMSFDVDGNLTGRSQTMQITNPRENGEVSGGVTVVDVTRTGLTLDWMTGATKPTEVARVAYLRSESDQGVEEINLPGTELFTIDLSVGTGSGAFGGLAFWEENEDSAYEYVVSLDSTLVFKISLQEGISGKRFLRGDANSDNRINISDPSFILNYKWKGGREPLCFDAADANDDEMIDSSDAIYLFVYLFLTGAPPPNPFGECGFDLEPELPCARTVCEG